MAQAGRRGPALAVLVEDHVKVCCLLVSVALAEVGGTPAHHVSIKDSLDV
jgi:hypothetical protein